MEFKVLSFMICILCKLVICHGLQDAPVFRLNLDLPPEERWFNISTHYSFMAPKFRRVLHEVIPQYLDLAERIITEFQLQHYFPDEYARELVGVAKGMNMSLSEVFLMNLVYEATALCTSIVATDANGKVLHARNMDFDFLDLLKDLVSTVVYHRDGKTVFITTSFVPQISAFTVLKPYMFTLTVNQRLSGSRWIALLEALLFRKVRTVGVFVRQVAEQSQSYSEALESLKQVLLIAPVYFIVGGVNKDEGAIVTRGQLGFCDVYPLNSSVGRWFLVETNYDHWESPPPGDDRRTPAMHDMNLIGQQNITLQGMLTVLVKPPVFSPLTIYSTLMSATYPDQYWVRLRPPE